MAPIHDQKVHSIMTFSSPLKMNSCVCRCCDDGLLNYYLPIFRKGLFLQDSFFEYVRQVFDDTIRDILRRWNETGFLGNTWNDTNFRLSENLSRYRRLRAQHQGEENQAVTVTSDSTGHKIVMDVHDFMDGEVKVKVVGETEVVVEARTKTNNGEFSRSCQSFRRRFSLPDLTEIESITSVISSDGILTVTVPKMETQRKVWSRIPIRITGVLSNKDTHTPGLNTQAVADKCLPAVPLKLQDKEKTCVLEDYQQQELRQGVINSQDYREGETTSEIFDTDIASNEIYSQTKGSQLSCEYLPCSREKTKSPSVYSQKSIVNDKETKDIHRSNTTDAPTKNSLKSLFIKSPERETISACSDSHFPRCSSLSIPTRGLFFKDPVFADSRQDFRDAVRDVVSKWGDGSSATDDMTCYRSLRARNMRDDNQAVRSSENEFNYKFVLDVHDFANGGEISAKFLDERELVVEGRVEKVKGDPKSVKQFLRHFFLPGGVQIEAIMAIMSLDGVLTITVPKKISQPHLKEIVVHKNIEKDENPESQNESPNQEVKIGAEKGAREASPTLSIESVDSCDGSLDGRLWSFSSPIIQSPDPEEFSAPQSPPYSVNIRHVIPSDGVLCY
ncbi:uncharacterized protein LOC121878438 [Homarus americanus]|uniref:uncharacterized protein LOC121878438 n=1 Tax=Homarus americanus TaxID=6706 RepID=UPI001C4640B7|nr:uncharacterized protein LOC121878438 [Homarus americanus]